MSELTSWVCEDPDELGPAREQWDTLAAAVGKPFSMPGWGLAWWHHLRPKRACLRVVLVQEGDRLIGVFPLFSVGREYRSLGGGLAPVEPLAVPGMAERVASASAVALSECEPAPSAVELERHESSPAWAALLRDAWPGGRGGWLWTKSTESVPYTEVPTGFEDWFEGRSASFRREMRRKQRRLETAGGEFREATLETLPEDVRIFLRLHRARLAEKGGTSLGSPAVEQMLVAAGAELLDAGRLRLLTIDLDGEPIAAQLVVSGGGEVCAWNTGFDEAHAKLSPLMLCMLRVVREAADNSDRRVSLGPGGQAYKYRLCDEEDALLEEVFAPRGASYPAARLRLAPAQLRAWARRVRTARSISK